MLCRIFATHTRYMHNENNNMQIKLLQHEMFTISNESDFFVGLICRLGMVKETISEHAQTEHATK